MKNKKPGWPAGTDQVIPAHIKKCNYIIPVKGATPASSVEIIETLNKTCTIRVQEDNLITEITDVPIKEVRLRGILKNQMRGGKKKAEKLEREENRAGTR